MYSFIKICQYLGNEFLILVQICYSLNIRRLYRKTPYLILRKTLIIYQKPGGLGAKTSKSSHTCRIYYFALKFCKRVLRSSAYKHLGGTCFYVFLVLCFYFFCIFFLILYEQKLKTLVFWSMQKLSVFHVYQIYRTRKYTKFFALFWKHSLGEHICKTLRKNNKLFWVGALRNLSLFKQQTYNRFQKTYNLLSHFLYFLTTSSGVLFL